METNTTINITADEKQSVKLIKPDSYWEASGLLGILTRCSAAFGVEPEDVKSRSRREENVFARQAYCYMAYRQTSQSAANIGRLIGRDHATVSHSVKTVENYLKVNYRRFTDIYNMLLVDI